ncbi:hypothetical protein [Actinosynnema pretiosum]|uniref:Uncharacterized protein n=1 Tax=Actinosynnema pretiosum TaxID=42197 RepID=A0A290Z3F4_9PSEU|nr:hypothetical protein [Actinosynnema pretiosum]ATE53571.1 hypothetical protein CNX65_09935 [Actinosynnema pretiosum]
MADGFTALYRTGWSPRRVERPTASRAVAVADRGVRCAMRRVAPEAVVEESPLDADPDAQDRLITLVLTRARQLGDALLGLAVDRGGTTRALDLDGVVLGRPVPVDHVPDLLILRPEVAVRHPELSRCGLRVCGPFTAFDPAGLLDRL